MIPKIVNITTCFSLDLNGFPMIGIENTCAAQAQICNNKDSKRHAKSRNFASCMNYKDVHQKILVARIVHSFCITHQPNRTISITNH